MNITIRMTFVSVGLMCTTVGSTNNILALNILGIVLCGISVIFSFIKYAGDDNE